MSKIPAGLQDIINRFLLFCTDIGLEFNITKTKFMALNPYRSAWARILVQNSPLEQVPDLG